VVADGRHPSLRWPHFPFYRDELRRIYEDRGWQLLWIDDGRLRTAATEAVEVLASAPERGLDPRAYDVAHLRERMARFRAGELTPPEAALLDAALTVGLLRHVSDVHIGRINPANLHFGFNIEPKKWDLARVLTDAVGRDRIAATVRAAEPPFGQYRDLKAALARYRLLAESAGPWELPDPPGTLQPEDRWAGAGELARLLTALGDLPPGTAIDAGSGPGGEGRLDPALVRGLRAFQERHGLAVDGVLGPATLAALRVPPSERVRQIELALERIRWLPEPTGRPFIVVNIPAFELWAFDGDPDATPALSMRVVVGRSLRTRTPAFVEEMEYLVFSPYWNLPYSITVNEVLPALRQDPDHLVDRGMEAVPAGRTDPGAGIQRVDEADLARIASGDLRIRQRPGPANSLGPAKFIFPNAHNVYLHGTPATELFQRSRRDFSHGCVRVEDPGALAAWLLADRPEWTPGRIAEAMASGRPQRVDLEAAVPVVLLYTTAMVRPDGRMAFLDDIYGHDAVLERALATGYPYAP
jgi:murein L,D-transpeptidase YcbB/YkuD